MDDRDRGAHSQPHPCRVRSLSLVIPAYNEEAGIRQAVAEADDALARLADDYDILVVDDGSRDGTAGAVAAVSRERPRVRLLRHGANRGYGAALRTGFEAARGDLVAFTDADCQFDLADLGRLLALADQAPLAVGYRAARQDVWARRFFSWGYNRLVRVLLGTGVRDCDCALKVFRRDALEKLLPETAGFFVNTEMLTRARQQGLRVAEAAVRHRPRLRGASKVSPADVPRTLGTLLPFWWSRVLFAGRENECREGARWDILLVLAAAALLFFWRLGGPLQEPDEARYAEVPRQMLETGSWVVPVLHGRPYCDKPPLFYWLVMASYEAFGVHERAARLASSGSAFLVVLVTYLWGRRALGRRAALAGAAVLALSARFVYLGRLLTPDSLLCLCVVAGWAAAHRAACGGRLRRGWWLASAGACGLGLLTKGPVSLALVAVPVLAYQLLDPRAARPTWRAWAAYLAAALGLAAPWYAAMTAAEPGFADHFFWRHNVLRYVEPFDHAKPAWYHLPGLFLGVLPWALLLPGLCRFVARRSARAAARRPAGLGFVLLAFLWCLLFYSLSGCKRAVYILPALPPLALALGCYLNCLLPRDSLGRGGAALLTRGSRPAARAALLALVLGAAGCLVAVGAGLLGPREGAAGATLLALAAVLVWRRRDGVSWAGCGAAVFVLLFAGVDRLQPGYARKFSLRGQVRSQQRLGQDARAPVACYPRRWDSVTYYLRRDDVRAFHPGLKQDLLEELKARPETIVFVKSGEPFEELTRELPEGMEFVPHGRQGAVTAGRVRPRGGADPGLFARR